VVVFPSILGFDDAAPPFPPFPFAPFGGDDLRDEDELAVKYLYLPPLPSPPPPDLEEKNEKARACWCVVCVVVDVDVTAAAEASETVGRAATSLANIYEEMQEVRKERVGWRGSPPSDSPTGFQKRNESRGHRTTKRCHVPDTIESYSKYYALHFNRGQTDE